MPLGYCLNIYACHSKFSIYCLSPISPNFTCSLKSLSQPYTITTHSSPHQVAICPVVLPRLFSLGTMMPSLAILSCPMNFCLTFKVEARSRLLCAAPFPWPPQEPNTSLFETMLFFIISIVALVL